MNKILIFFMILRGIRSIYPYLFFSLILFNFFPKCGYIYTILVQRNNISLKKHTQNISLKKQGD
jgi:hypothetical protein